MGDLIALLSLFCLYKGKIRNITCLLSKTYLFRFEEDKIYDGKSNFDQIFACKQVYLWLNDGSQRIPDPTMGGFAYSTAKMKPKMAYFGPFWPKKPFFELLIAPKPL